MSKITYKDRASTTRIILHDSHTAPDVSQIEEVSRWHIDAQKGAHKMGLMSIGYHFIVERDGNVVPCREQEKIGSHTPGCNMDSIGICWVGGRDGDGDAEDNMTTMQRRSLLALCSALIDTYGPLRVIGHSELQRFRNPRLSKCPFMDMELFREDLKLYKQIGYVHE